MAERLFKRAQGEIIRIKNREDELRAGPPPRVPNDWKEAEEYWNVKARSSRKMILKNNRYSVHHIIRDVSFER